MRKSLLFYLLIGTVSVFGQDELHTRIKAELSQWDSIRGEWLAESVKSIAENREIPDRTFPEDLTPSELFALVPADRKARIQQIASESFQPQAESANQSTSNRVPVGSTSNDRVQNPNTRYRDFFTRTDCGIIQGRTYGDPHIRTFDGQTYSFQTVGEYILTSSPDRLFEVQTRQKPQSNDVSLNTAVAMNVYGDRVGIYASDFPDRVANSDLRVNGRTVYMQNETYFLPRGGTIQKSGNEYVVTWPSGEKVQAKLSSTGRMRFINITVFVHKCNGDYFGLLGNGNGRTSDDFSGSNRVNNLASSTIFLPFDSRDFGRINTAMEREHLAFLARDFGNQYLVNDVNTLFEYRFGESSWTFYDPSFPRNYVTLNDISQAERDRAWRECQRQGILADDMNGCVMDLAHGRIDPTPRSSNPDRVTGRDLNPLSGRVPNVNRPDVHGDVGTPRTPSTGTRPTRDANVDGVTGVNSTPNTVTRENGKANDVEASEERPVRRPVDDSFKGSVGVEPENGKGDSGGNKIPVGTKTENMNRNPNENSERPRPVDKKPSNTSTIENKPVEVERGQKGSGASKPSTSTTVKKPVSTVKKPSTTTSPARKPSETSGGTIKTTTVPSKTPSSTIRKP